MSEKPVVLYSEEQIRRRIAELGTEIAKAYGGQEIAVVGLMKSCLVFMADLIRAIPLPLTVHMVRTTLSDKGTRIAYSFEVAYEGRHILLLDDIIDTGVTLSYLVDHIKEHHPRSLRICALIDRATDRKVDLRPDWAAFTLKEPLDRFIVGYGLDYRERDRNLPYIGTISKPAPAKADSGGLNLSLGS